MALHALSLSLQFGQFAQLARHRAALPRHSVTRWIRHALDSDAEITVRIVDAEEGQRLNREFRGKDYATNVLTFDYAQVPVVMADLVLCAPVVARDSSARCASAAIASGNSCCGLPTMRPASACPNSSSAMASMWLRGVA